MQPVRLCTHKGCFDATIKAARSLDHCRSHYRSDVLAEAADLVQCEVLCNVGSRGEETGVTDAVTNEIVHFGETVTLDPRETNIPALVAGGIVRVIPSAAAEALKA